MGEKPVRWVGGARQELRAFPDTARQRAGYQLFRLQTGLLPTDWRPMRTVGRGVQEIRIHTDGEYRVIYVAGFQEAVYVLHAFEKKGRRTPTRHLTVAQRRLRAVLEARLTGDLGPDHA